MIEHDVRELLRRRAGDASASPDAWERIAERIATDEAATTVSELGPRRRHGRPGAMAAIAAALLLVVTSVAVIRERDTDEAVRAADGPSTPPPGNREPATGPPAAAPGQPSVWPATTDEVLARLQAEADAGRRPDLLDPRAVAGAYLSERFFDQAARRLTQDFAVGEFAQGDPSSGEVPYQSPPRGDTGGTVLVRRAGGDGAIWFVVGSASHGVDARAAYDGSVVTGTATVARPGTLDVTIVGTDGSDRASSESREAAPATPITLEHRVAGTQGVIVRLRLVEAPSGTVSFAEYRVDRAPRAAVPPDEATFEATAEAAARRWIRSLAVGEGDVAWDLLAEGSRSATGGRSGFDARLGELADGWGAWDAAPDVSYRTVLLVGDATDGTGDLPAVLPRLGVVIVSGRVSQEGTTAYRTMSMPVRGTREKAQVDPFVDVAVELGPADGARIAPGAPVTTYTVSGGRIWFILDDRSPVGPDTSEGADGDQQKATVTPAPALSSGRHSLTVVVLSVDGRVASRSATSTVA